MGALLLMDRTLLAIQVMAVHAIVVDAKDAAAAKFYRKYGFIDFPNNTQRLFLPMATIRQLQEACTGQMKRCLRWRLALWRRCLA